MQNEEEWNMMEETAAGEVDFPVKTATDNQSHAYTLDDDGSTVETVWESMSYDELRIVCSPLMHGPHSEQKAPMCVPPSAVDMHVQ
jgi:hypothetical protein